MRTRYSEFRMKEVVNVCDGCRLGYVSDLELELPDGHVCAIVLPGPCRWMGLLGHDGELVIPWQCIRQIGADLILVEIDREKYHVPHPRKLPLRPCSL